MLDDVQAHRCVPPIKIELYHPLLAGFSNFQFLEDSFESFAPNRDGAVRRCFSLARMLETATLVRELIDPAGMLLYQHEQLSRKRATVNGFIFRFSFWREFLVHEDEIKLLSNDDCLGYAIVQEIRLETGEARWNVFEAVFRSVTKPNWVLPHVGVYDFNVGGCRFSIRGNLYCQQDGLSTVCAHVALRTLISRVSPLHDISYEKIDQVAKEVHSIDLKLGLTIGQIEKVLEDAELEYEDFCYDKDLISEKGNAMFVSGDIPIERLIHAGVESGFGSLFGFKVESKVNGEANSCPSPLTAEAKKDSRHIIPIFGHSFNGLAWFNEAGRQYFREKNVTLLYSTGTCWTDGYLGHDDNVGPEVFIPQNYVQSKYHSYVLNLLKSKYHCAGIFVEDVARELMETYIGKQLPKTTHWSRRLRQMVLHTPTEIVYRALSMTRRDYCKWLVQSRDWEGRFELETDCLLLEKELPELLWVVEVSCPHLYPGNLRKIGDIIFDARSITQKERSCSDQPTPLFSIARFPMLYMIHPRIVANTDDENDKGLAYGKRESRIFSHTSCIPVGVGKLIRNI